MRRGHADHGPQQRDDERYMIPVEHSPDAPPQSQNLAWAATTLPEVAPHQENTANDKYVVPEHSLETTPPPVDSPTPLTSYETVAPVPTPETQAGHAGNTSRAGTICGLGRPVFWTVLVLAVLVVIGAVVGGVVGGLKANDSSSDAAPAPTQSAAPLAASQRAIAAATTSGNSNSTLQVFYQGLSTTIIFYRLVWSDKAQEQQNATLTVPPNKGTPLAATAHNSSDSGDVVLNLFYLSTDADQNMTLARATLQCSNGASNCITSYNEVISGNFTQGRTISQTSRLSAILMNETTDEFRVYVQASGSFIWELSTTSDSSSWGQRMVNEQAQMGTSIGATNRGVTDNLLLVYTYLSNGLLRSVNYNDTVGFLGSVNVASSAGPGWTTTAKFGVCYDRIIDQYHIYYVAPSTGEIVAYWRQGPDNAWNQSIDSNWAKADGDIATVGWRDQVRLIYFNNGILSMNVQTPDGWQARINL